MIWIVLSVVAIFLGLVVYSRLKDNKRDVLTVWFGCPGAGKTTFAAWLVKRDLKKKRKVYSNVPITGALKLEPSNDIGKYMIVDGRVIIDEAGLEYNSREYKTFSANARYFYKYHRHYQCPVDVFSQGYDDMDKTLRVLAQRLYVVEKCLLPWFVKRKTIGKRVGIDENTKQIIDEYYFVPFGTKYIYCPPLWKTFNTISRKEFPEKVWEKW